MVAHTLTPNTPGGRDRRSPYKYEASLVCIESLWQSGLHKSDCLKTAKRRKGEGRKGEKRGEERGKISPLAMEVKDRGFRAECI